MSEDTKAQDLEALRAYALLAISEIGFNRKFAYATINSDGQIKAFPDEPTLRKISEHYGFWTGKRDGFLGFLHNHVVTTPWYEMIVQL